MGSNGINAVLMQLAEAATKHHETEKRSFVPMPGGAPAGGAGGGAPPMDPAMMGGAGGGAPPMDPMAMAATGADPAAIMAAGGAPVDPMMAAAGGATGVPAGPPAGPEGAPAGGEAPAEGAKPSKGGGQKEKLDEIHNMLTKIMGVLVGKGLLAPDELGDLMGAQAGGQPGAEAPPQGGIPAEQKIASEGEEKKTDEPEKVGEVVEDKGEDVTIPAEKTGEVKNALAGLILALGGNKK